MTIKSTLGLGLAAAAALTFAPITSHAGDDMMKAEKAFKAADTDGNGSLSKDEFMTMKKKKMSKSGDMAKDDVDAATSDASADSGDNIQ